MMWRDVVGLIAVTKKPAGYNTFEDVDLPPRDVPANKASVWQKEFYDALAVGIRPEVKFEIMAHDYFNEPKLIHEGTTYHIIRTFSKKGEKIELICSRFPMETICNG